MPQNKLKSSYSETLGYSEKIINYSETLGLEDWRLSEFFNHIGSLGFHIYRLSQHMQQFQRGEKGIFISSKTLSNERRNSQDSLSYLMLYIEEIEEALNLQNGDIPNSGEIKQTLEDFHLALNAMDNTLEK